MSRKIFVALSGGVDSAVSAALLVRAGYSVEGVYLKYASETVHGFLETAGCSWEDDLRSVEAIGRHLGIPVRSVNVEREYDQLVISDFLSEYAAGRTPNPDILCNRFIKFGFFFDWAMKNGGEAIATGHYARILWRAGRPILAAGRDPEKDQSYFLHALAPDILDRVLFPIGHLQKSEVRKLAKAFKLPNANRPDSQGVCFIGHLKVRDFLKARIAGQAGPIVDVAGRQLGLHDGLAPFTVGQRHGLGIGGGRPYFVVQKNLETNSLIVAASGDRQLYASHLLASGVHWSQPPQFPVHCQARIRYRQPLTEAEVNDLGNGRITVSFQRPQRAIAPGQAVVLYDGEIVLGGAVIDASLTNISSVMSPV